VWPPIAVRVVKPAALRYCLDLLRICDVDLQLAYLPSCLIGPTRLLGLSMQSRHFYLAHEAPMLRYSSSIPRIGDTVSLPELGGDLATLQSVRCLCGSSAMIHT